MVARTERPVTGGSNTFPMFFLSLRAEVESALREALADLELPSEDLEIEEPPEDSRASPPEASPASSWPGRQRAPAVGRHDDRSAVDADKLEFVSRIETQESHLNFLPSDVYLMGLSTRRSTPTTAYYPIAASRLSLNTRAQPRRGLHVGRATRSSETPSRTSSVMRATTSLVTTTSTTSTARWRLHLGQSEPHVTYR